MNAASKALEDYGMTDQEHDFFQRGWDAHAAGREVDDCSALNMRLEMCFRAGWHERDMKLGNRIYNGPERPRREV